MSEHTPQVPHIRGPTGSVSPHYFDALYAASGDPWDFSASRYEAEKYAATLAALPRSRYARALELGCSIGVLTRRLAERCERLVAIDVSAVALQDARHRCANRPHVLFEQRDLCTSFPAGSFDLILVSEIGYYFSRPDLLRLRANLADALEPQGHLLAVHYTGKTDYPLTADAVHECFRSSPSGWRLLRAERKERYRLDLFEAGLKDGPEILRPELTFITLRAR